MKTSINKDIFLKKMRERESRINLYRRREKEKKKS